MTGEELKLDVVFEGVSPTTVLKIVVSMETSRRLVTFGNAPYRCSGCRIDCLFHCTVEIEESAMFDGCK